MTIIICGKLNFKFCPELATLLKEPIGTMKISCYIMSLDKTLYLAFERVECYEASYQVPAFLF